MEKNRLLLIPFFLGLILMVCSWYLSYPLSIDNVDDFIFSHISILYWFSLPLLLPSMYMMAVTFKSNTSKWLIAVGILVTIYSLFYFYNTMPTSDANFFRGLTENLIETKNLDPLQPYHEYYQWPSFFVLSQIATSITGLTLPNFEFLLFTIIGFLLSTALYVYTSKSFKDSGFLAVAAFFVSMFYFFNYQCAPFSLALGLLFLLLMLETEQKSSGVMLTTIVLFVSISITHAFVPLFFVLYCLMRIILTRSKQYGTLFLFSLITYFVIQFALAPLSFAQNIAIMMQTPLDFSGAVEATLTSALVPIDIIAQVFSRTVTIAFVIICGIGFILMFSKKKLRALDKAILLTGIFYSGVGLLLYTLGTRAISIAFIPISLGAAYLLGTKFKSYSRKVFSVLIAILLLLFVFVPLHISFSGEVFFQTQETYTAENFFIDNYNFEKPSLVLAHTRVITYLRSKLNVYQAFVSTASMVKEANTILYTLGLGKSLLEINYTMGRLFNEKRLNVIYDNGFSYIAIQS